MQKTNTEILSYQEHQEYLNLVQNKKYFIRTYGCQMNEHDSENIMALIEKTGFTRTDEMIDADLIILNTCSIRENANNKVYGMLGRIKHLKQQKKDVIVALCGCMAQEDVVIDKIKEKYKFINIIFGTCNITSLERLIYETLKNKAQKIEVSKNLSTIVENIPVKRVSKTKAYINIIYGCDKFCTYCIVPYTRGRERSRRKEDILEEVNRLVQDGYLEITLLGQNVNAYGHDLYDNYSLAELLSDIAKTSIPRIRFITSHPWNFTDKMIEVIKEYPNIMPYIHLPIQSGSNKILKMMNRKYTKEEYITLYNKLRQIDNVSITTDIIVGFPGETEEDFKETLSIVETLKYDGAFTFIYSKRSNTPSASFKDQVEESTKEERLQRLNKIVNKYALISNQNYLNKEVLVLVEGPSTKQNMLYGYTESFKLINFKAEQKLIGKIVKVRVTDAKSFSLDGVVLD